MLTPGNETRRERTGNKGGTRSNELTTRVVVGVCSACHHLPLVAYLSFEESKKVRCASAHGILPGRIVIDSKVPLLFKLGKRIIEIAWIGYFRVAENLRVEMAEATT